MNEDIADKEMNKEEKAEGVDNTIETGNLSTSDTVSSETVKDAETDKSGKSYRFGRKPKSKSKPEEELQKELAELKDKYLRLFSEFDNYRKRTQREKADLLKMASGELISSLLTVLDDFERATKSIESNSDIAALREGVDLIHNKFRNILIQKGLEPMDSIGNEFNTDLHEAITKIAVDNEELKGKVVDVIEKGYILQGKVLRFAKVVVGS